MLPLLFSIGLLATFTFLTAAWLWFQASGGRVRRVHMQDVIDGPDIARLRAAGHGAP